MGQISISKAILGDLPLDQLTSACNTLKRILGDKFSYFVPEQINDLATLNSILYWSKYLPKLEHADNFSKHLELYNKDQIASTQFVTRVASYFVDRVDSIVFEPVIDGGRNRADILIHYRGQQIYLECKSLDISYDYFAEHERIFCLLRPYLLSGYQVDIKYRNTPSEEDTHRLGKTLQERLPLVTGNGFIINNEDMELQVTKQETNADNPLCVCLTGISEDIDEQSKYPLHVFMQSRFAVSLAGPKVDFKSVIREKLRKSKKQYSAKDPFVLLIDANAMLGNLKENLKAVSTAFQPELNTRFSAAVLVSSFFSMKKPALDFTFNLVSNPYARVPVHQDFQRVLASPIGSTG